MSDFVYDGTTLPDGKVDARPVSGAADESISASEWNEVMQAVYDVRSAVTAGQYHGLASTPTAAVSAAGAVRLRSNAGVLEASQGGAAYDGLATATQLATKAAAADLTALDTRVTANESVIPTKAPLDLVGHDVADSGAVGDGTTDDTAALKAAITAAGVGGILRFRPGKTYVISAVLQPLTGQTWIGYGAAIKRKDETVTTTTTAITTSTNPTTITVASTAGLAVGMTITVTSGPNNTDGCYVAHTITAISGLDVTVSSNFTKAFPSGGTVVTNHGLVYIPIGTTDVSLLGLELDGNRANNTHYTCWQTQAGIDIGGDRGTFRDLYIHDSTSDGIELGGEGSILDGCVILRSGGNCIHLSGATGVRVVNNYCKDATLAITGTDNTTGPDHAEGVVTFSASIVDTILANNHFENGRSCIGGIGSSDNSDITISNNTMRGATLYALEIIDTELSGTVLRNIVIQGNRFYDCAPVTISNNQSGGHVPAAGPRNTIFAANLLVNTTFMGTRLHAASIIQNIFDLTGDTTSLAIKLSSPQNVLVTGNQFLGGRYGVYIGKLDSATGTESATRDLIIEQNFFTNQYDGSFQCESETGVCYKNTTFGGNTIREESGYPSAGYVAIQGMRGLRVYGNSIDMIGGSKAIVCAGDVVATPAGVPGTIVSENMVRTDTATSIKIYGGDGNNIVHHNYTTSAISNGQPANNTVENNYSIL